MSMSVCMSLWEYETCSFETCINQVNGHLGFLHVNRGSLVDIKINVTEGIRISEIRCCNAKKKLGNHPINVFISCYIFFYFLSLMNTIEGKYFVMTFYN